MQEKSARWPRSATGRCGIRPRGDAWIGGPLEARRATVGRFGGLLCGAALALNQSYVSGDMVSYGGDTWTASQWNYGEQRSQVWPSAWKQTTAPAETVASGRPGAAAALLSATGSR